MSRSQRLLELIQILRRNKFPVSGTVLATELGISVRTLYRDIGTLQEQGASIDGEPGLGYILRPGFMLPPMMFSEDEIEALVLGSRWVADRADPRLGAAARNALARIAAVLPPDMHRTMRTSGLIVGPDVAIEPAALDLSPIRKAIRAEQKIDIVYRDLKGVESSRTVWPFALSFFERARIVVAWCELRQTFRHFRMERILTLAVSPQRYPRRRQVLLKEWRESEGIPLN
jgi:predicted DNA-binding transcriptional regulator YafY